jgi:hypothetical protein
MNDEQVFQLLAETNPVPKVGVGVAPVALGDADQGGRTMATTNSRLSPERRFDSDPTPGRRWGALLAAAAVLLVLIGGAAMWALVGRGNEVADEPGMSSVLAAYDAMNNGNIDAFYSHLTEHAVEVDDHEYRLLDVEMHEQTELSGPCRQLKPSPTSGKDRIQCDVKVTNDLFRPARIWLEVTDTFVIARDGRIDVVLSMAGDNTSADDYSHAFWSWLADAHPDVYDTIWGAHPDPETIRALTAFAHTDIKLAARNYVDEFIAQSSEYPVN